MFDLQSPKGKIFLSYSLKPGTRSLKNLRANPSFDRMMSMEREKNESDSNLWKNSTKQAIILRGYL
jgi:hypothetical protein